MTAECPICGESEHWNRRRRSCQACGHYDEEHAHGVVARQRKRDRRRLARRRDRP